MPEGRSIEHHVAPEENLEAEKEKLFAEIQSHIEEDAYSNESRYALMRVLGHSLSDGLELGKKVQEQYGGEDLLDFPVSDILLYQRIKWLYARQSELFKQLRSRFLQSLTSVPLMSRIFRYGSGPYVLAHNGNEIFLEAETDLEKKIDAFYLKVFPHRLEEKHTKEDLAVPLKARHDAPQTTEFKKAEATMERSKIFLSPHYYTGDFQREVLFPALKDQIEPGGNIKTFIENFPFPPDLEYLKLSLLSSSHISNLDANQCFEIFGIQITPEIGQIMERIKYQPDIVDSRMIDLAKGGLRKKIQESLPAGYVLKKDSTGEWKVSRDPEFQKEKLPEREQQEGSFFDFEKWEKTEFRVPDDISDNFGVIIHKRKTGFCLKLHDWGRGVSYKFYQGTLTKFPEDKEEEFFSSSHAEVTVLTVRVEDIQIGTDIVSVSLEGGKTVEYKAKGLIIGCDSSATKKFDSLYFCDWESSSNKQQISFVEVTPRGEVNTTAMFDAQQPGEVISEVFFSDEKTVGVILRNLGLEKRTLFFDISNGKPSCIFTSGSYKSIQNYGSSGILCKSNTDTGTNDFFVRKSSTGTMCSYENVDRVEKIVNANTLGSEYKIYQHGGVSKLIAEGGEEVDIEGKWTMLENTTPLRLIGTAYNAQRQERVEFSDYVDQKGKLRIHTIFPIQEKQTIFGTLGEFHAPLGDSVKPFLSINGEHIFELEDDNGERALAVNEDTVYPGFQEASLSDTEACFVFYNQSTGVVSMYRRALPSQESSKNQPSEYTPNDTDLRMLELLNAFETQDRAIDYIDKYLPKVNKDTLKQKINRLLGRADKKRTLELAAKNNPEGFFPSMTVNFDSPSNIVRTADIFLQTFFPSAYPYPPMQGGHKRRSGIQNVGSYLNPEQGDSKIMDGDPEEKKPNIIFTSRRKVSGFYPTRFVGKYNSVAQSFKDVQITFHAEKKQGGVQETYTLPVPHGLGEIILPISSQGELLPERVVGIKMGVGGGAQEVRLSPVKSAQGIWTVSFPKDVTQIVYSELRSLPHEQKKEIPSVNRSRYREGIISETGDDLTQDIFDTLPFDWGQFLSSLQGKTVEEQIEAVQQFVLSISYYDFKNKQVMGEKDHLTPSERVLFMKQRLRALEKREKNTEKKTKLQQKQLAGVCADFALVTMGLLRRLGIPAGLVSGLLVQNSDTITTNNQHRVVLVPLPTERKGEYTPRLVETTPSGLTNEEEQALQQIRLVVDKENNEGNKESEQKEMKKLEEQLKALQQIYDEERVLDILDLQNGKLENALNVILKVGVKQHHVKMFESIFSIVRYGGVDITDTDMVSDLAKTLIEESRRQHTGKEINETSGTDLIHLFQEYIFRYTRDGEKKGDSKTKARLSALAALQKIVSVVSPHLEHIEKMVALVVLADLRAQGMSSFARPSKK